MEVFQLYLQLGKQRKIGWLGDVLVRTSLVKKEV
jgi:hypothetical protein